MGPKNRKGRRGDDSDDDPLADQLAHLKTLKKPEEEEEAAPSNNKGGKDNKAAKKDKKDNKKKGGKKDDSDDEDPLLAMKKLAMSSDDEGASVPSSKAESTVASNQAKKGNKKDKKDNKKKGGKRGDSDDDVDPLQAMKAMAQSSDDEDAPAPAPVAKPAAATDKKSKDSKQDSKQDTKKDSKKDGKKDGKKGKAAAREESESEASEAEEQEIADPEPVRAPEPVAAPVAAKAEEPKKEKKSSKKDKDKDSAPAAAPEPPAESLREIESKANAAKKAKAVAAVAPVVEAAPVLDPNRKMSKLEMKLEKARKDKAEADAQAAIVAAAAAQAAAEEAERARVEAAALAAQQAAERERLKAEQGEDSDSEDSGSDDDDSADEQDGNKAPRTAEEIEREARMMSTMYGDDVFSEDRPGEDKPVVAAGASSGKKEKLSNKAKRKLQKEEEAKDREVEFNAAAMKASAEGAQFAVSQSVVNVDDPLWQNALDIIIPNLSVSAHKKELFVNAELSIVHGRRYGLVGPNGAGKSTLLKMIAAGQLKIPPRIDYLYVEQEVMADDTPAVDAVLRADKVRWELIQEEKAIMAALAKGDNDKLDTRLGEVHAELAVIGAASAESRARRILFGLGFDAEMQTRPTRFFSGGWRMRISLARALFIEPTLLMLDEPTNHLDLNAVIWLDDYLQKWKKTLLIVSHDQEFLNSVCEEIIHLEDKKLIFYKGNYDNFKEQEAVRRKQVQKEYEKQEKKLRELKAKGVTQKNAEKVQLKSKSREPGARSNKKAEAAAMASGGIESGESQLKLIERPRDYSVVFSFPEVVHLSPPIMEVRDVNFRYAPHLPWLFRDLNFGLDMSSRVCIVGPNGSGKSTIIKLITNELVPPEGEVRRNPRLRVGVYNQHFVERLPMDEDPVTYLRRLFNEETYQSVRNKLGKYGLEGHAHTLPIRDLSGGQKARVVFVELSFMAPHLLFLDEPTNNLDIESIDALCIALREFTGGVVLVSHDARLIETTECQLWVVENQGLTPWENGFNNYRQHLLKQLEDQLNAIMPGSGERPK